MFTQKKKRKRERERAREREKERKREKIVGHKFGFGFRNGLSHHQMPCLNAACPADGFIFKKPYLTNT